MPEVPGSGTERASADCGHAMTPTARTLARLRADGWTAEVVEQTVRAGLKVWKRDLFNVIDIIAAHPQRGILGVQTTSGAHAADRKAKALDEPKLLPWLRSGGNFEVWSWEKQGARGKRKLWTLRRQVFRLMGETGISVQEAE